MTLGEIRKARGLTQHQVAKRLKIGQPGVSRLENREDPYVQTIKAFVTAMGGSIEFRAVFPDGKRRIIL